MRTLLAILSVAGLLACSSKTSTAPAAAPSENASLSPTTITVTGKIMAPITEAYVTLASFDPITQKADNPQLYDVNTDGTFSFTTELSEPALMRLKVHNSKAAMILLEPALPEVSVEFSGKKNELPVLTNSPASQLLAAYDVFRNESLARLISPTYADMRTAKKAGDEEAEVAAVARYVHNSTLHRKELLDWTEANIGTSPALFGTVLRWTGDDETTRLRTIVDRFAAAHPAWEMTRVMLDKVSRYERVAIGVQAPELEGKSPSGEVIKLSENLGKVTLIDFWASWCAPCIAQLPELRSVYQEFAEDGLVIFGLSVDKNGDQWRNAVKKHEMPWRHASDLAGWDSPNATRYNVTFVPYNVLLDAEGKIVGKNLHEKELRSRVRELLDR